MRRKVLIIHYAHWEQQLGGAELQLKYMAEALANAGNEVYVIYLNYNNKQVKSGIVKNIPIKKIFIPSILGQSHFLYLRSLKNKIKEIAPDLIITRTFSSWAGIAAKYAHDHKIKHVHFIASDREVNKKVKRWYKLFDMIEKAIHKNIFKINNVILITQNDFQHNAIKNRYKVLSFKATQAAPLSNMSRIVKSKNTIKIVWVANFKPLKQPEKFIEIAKHFKDRKDIQFIMIGGYKNSHYEQLIEEHSYLENIQFLGAVSNDCVNQELDSTHILINTSDYEGFSNTFVQAWMREVVVLSLNSDPDNILTEQEIGFRCESIENMVSIISMLCSDKVQLEYMGKKSRSYAKNNHSIDRVYQSLFKQMLD